MKNYVLTYAEFLNESESVSLPIKLKITEINDLLKKYDKVWILTGGAPGAGKSYIAKKYINLPIIDMDDYVEKLSGGKGKYNPNLGSKARVLARSDVDKNLKFGKSFLKQGTSAIFNAVKNQCEQAKAAGFICIFLYIDIPINQAFSNNKKRTESGERESSVPDFVIERKLKDSRTVFKLIQNSANLFNYYSYYLNKM